MESLVSSSRLTEIGEAMREDLPWFTQQGWQGWGCEGVVVKGSRLGFLHGDAGGELEEWGCRENEEAGGASGTSL